MNNFHNLFLSLSSQTMSTQPETEKQQPTEVEWVEQPAHGRKSPAPPRLSESQLKLALMEMAEPDRPFSSSSLSWQRRPRTVPAPPLQRQDTTPPIQRKEQPTRTEAPPMHRLVSPPLCPHPHDPALRLRFAYEGAKVGSLLRGTRPGCGPPQPYTYK